MRVARLLLGKDLRLLARARGVLALVVLYPVALAALVGLAVQAGGGPARVAFVDEDHLPAVIRVGGVRLDVERVLADTSRNVRLVRMDRARAERSLEAGDVVGVVVVPRGFLAQLRTLLVSPTLVLETGRSPFRTEVRRQAEALVYRLDQRLQSAYIRANVDYLDVLVRGGRTTFLGRRIDVLGLQRADEVLGRVQARVPPGTATAGLTRVRRFAHQATLALGAARGSLEATAHPVVLEERARGTGSSLLGSRLLSYGVALSLALAALLLGAGALALEHEEGVLARLGRGRVDPGWLVAEKVTLSALFAVALGVLVTLAGAVVLTTAGDGAPWSRLPLLVVPVVLVGVAAGAAGTLVGGLARDVRTATVSGLAVALPLVLLGLVTAGGSAAASWASAVFPFLPAARAVDAVLYSASPLRPLLVGGAHLAALALAYGALARGALVRWR